MMRVPGAVLAGTVAMAAVVLPGPAGAQNGSAPPPCAPGVAPAATIRGFDVEDGGGQLTATHTIGLEARDRNGFVPNVSFTLPDGAQDRKSTRLNSSHVQPPRMPSSA